jgi:hypothetical protein
LQEKSAQLENEIKGFTGQAEAKQKEVDLIRQELEGVLGGADRTTSAPQRSPGSPRNFSPWRLKSVCALSNQSFLT